MNLIALAPLIPPSEVGGSILLAWLISIVLVAALVWFIVWCVTKVFGPPSIPEPARWIAWAIVGVVVLIFIFAAFGMRIP